jgi:short subunit dehydrogenase-like uncharacterized protein
LIVSPASCGSDPASLAALAAATRVVLTTVGPYQLYGEALVAACAAAGTDYVDLCGEPAWMRRMIDAHDAAAKASGARIVFSCGFDSIPFDLGVLMVQNAAIARTGAPAPAVQGRVRKMKGTFSGGTAASLKATMAAAATDPGVLDLLRNPFALTPGFTGVDQPSGMKPYLDGSLGVWVAPFIMAPINTRNVHRTSFLLAGRYGEGFTYEEMLVTGPGEAGEAAARAVAGDRSLGSDKGPKPGEGPSKEEREAGHYDVLFRALSADGSVIAEAVVTGDRDPGYGSTSKMIGQSALALLDPAICTGGGIWTPGAAFGMALAERLKAHAGMTFDLVDA